MPKMFGYTLNAVGERRLYSCDSG